MNLWGPLGVAWFELRRTLSPMRLGVWLLLTLFPILLIRTVVNSLLEPPPADALKFVSFFLIVRVVAVMGLLLWATPVISSEIEGRTWIYFATRSNGSRSTVLGKYFVALMWAIPSGIVATLGVQYVGDIGNPAQFCTAMIVLVVLGSFAYGAVLALIGTIIQRRAMVVGMLYLVILEGVLSALPTTISQMTIAYRLQVLAIEWMRETTTELPEGLAAFQSTLAAPWHVVILILYAAVALFLAVLRADAGGYLTDPED